MEPYGRLVVNVGMLPGFPRKIGLSFTGDEAPVDGSDVLLFGDRQDRVEGAADRAGHVFGADHRTMKLSKPCDFGFEGFGPAVVVEGDNVGLAQLDALNFFYGALAFGCVDVPHSAGEWLSGCGLARPFEGLG